MKSLKIRISLLCFLLIVLSVFVLSCEPEIDNGSEIDNLYKYEYSYSCNFEIVKKPSGNAPVNLAFALQLPKEEKFPTQLYIKEFKVFINDEQIYSKANFKSCIEFNQWINDDGVSDSNYQVLYYCLPENFSGDVNIGDKVSIVFECKADRKTENTVKKFLIDNSREVGLWMEVGKLIVEPEEEQGEQDQGGQTPPENPESIKDDKQESDTKPENDVTKDSETSKDEEKNDQEGQTPPENPEDENNTPGSDTINYQYEFSDKYLYKILVAPLGKNEESLTLVLRLPTAQGSEIKYKVDSLKVYKNGTLINTISDVENQFWFCEWDNNNGGKDSCYQTLIKMLPKDDFVQINKKDIITIELKLKTETKINCNVQSIIIDNSDAANNWLQLGEKTFDYASEPIPNETCEYKGLNYKLVFYDDFNKDYSELNPLKNDVYKQPMDLNKWWTEDWGTYVNVSNGREHRSIRDFKIHDGVAEFPMIRRKAGETGELANAGPSIMTAAWDAKGVDSELYYEFNKGIFEIRFKGPEGNNHPGQFTFWVLNSKTNFEAGSYPTNPNKAADGYALDEIDFFEYSPSLNIIRTGSRSCNSINDRPAAGYWKKNLEADFGGKWHVFRCVWDEEGLTSYLDGSLMYTVSASSIKGFDNPDDKFMLLISSQSIKESGLDGDVYNDFEPYSYFVDYIKVYEKQ